MKGILLLLIIINISYQEVNFEEKDPKKALEMLTEEMNNQKLVLMNELVDKTEGELKEMGEEKLPSYNL